MLKRDEPFRVARLVAALSACALLVATAPAGAQTTCPTANRARAVRLAKHANVLMGEKKYDQAMDELRSAYALCPEAKLRHAMGCVQTAIRIDGSASGI
ncbi:MAG: hypothetical protein FJ087_15525 [Deltaproteobacteria bacterium]|nr:hypothetical protein [Deltaproteobacteria bacterium]